MPTYTLAELATRVLRFENLIAAEETPSAADLADTIDIIQSEMDSMAARGLVLWNSSPEATTTEFMMPLVKRLGPIVGASFGKYPTADATAAANNIERLELRPLAATPATGAVLEGQYF